MSIVTEGTMTYNERAIRERFRKNLAAGNYPESSYEFRCLQANEENIFEPNVADDAFIQAESIPFYMRNHNLLQVKRAIQWLRENLPSFRTEDVNRWEQEINDASEIQRRIDASKKAGDYDAALESCAELERIGWLKGDMVDLKHELEMNRNLQRIEEAISGEKPKPAEDIEQMIVETRQNNLPLASLQEDRLQRLRERLIGREIKRELDSINSALRDNDLDQARTLASAARCKYDSEQGFVESITKVKEFAVRLEKDIPEYRRLIERAHTELIDCDFPAALECASSAQALFPECSCCGELVQRCKCKVEERRRFEQGIQELQRKYNQLNTDKEFRACFRAARVITRELHGTEDKNLVSTSEMYDRLSQAREQVRRALIRLAISYIVGESLILWGMRRIGLR